MTELQVSMEFMISTKHTYISKDSNDPNVSFFRVFLSLTSAKIIAWYMVYIHYFINQLIVPTQEYSLRHKQKKRDILHEEQVQSIYLKLQTFDRPTFF